MIRIENIKKIYDGRAVVDIPSGYIQDHEITAVIGPSGAGKSTLLMMAAGLTKPDGGRIIFGDHEYSATKSYSPEAAKKMAMVFQKPVMFNTSVYENIAYGLKARKLPKEEIEQKVREIADWTGLANLLKQKAITLSGGEAGRVSLARAMVTRPELLLMDEPTANLDPANVAVIEEMIARANREFKTAIVIVTHNMFQARRLANQAICLMNGRITEEGPAEQIFENPQNEQTRSFVSGKMVY